MQKWVILLLLWWIILETMPAIIYCYTFLFIVSSFSGHLLSSHFFLCRAAQLSGSSMAISVADLVVCLWLHTYYNETKLIIKVKMSKSFLKTNVHFQIRDSWWVGSTPCTLTKPFICDISVDCHGFNRGHSKLADDR